MALGVIQEEEVFLTANGGAETCLQVDLKEEVELEGGDEAGDRLAYT